MWSNLSSEEPRKNKMVRFYRAAMVKDTRGVQICTLNSMGNAIDSLGMQRKKYNYTTSGILVIAIMESPWAEDHVRQGGFV